MIALDNDVISYCLFAFLTLRDIVKFDSAIAGSPTGKYFSTQWPQLTFGGAFSDMVFTKDSAPMNWFIRKRLQLRSLTFGPRIDDHDVIRFSELSRSLLFVTWSNCKISDNAICVLTRVCPQLQALKFTKCFSISDVSLRSISVHCLNLQLFHAIDNTTITASGIQSLLQGCPKLRNLGISNCTLLHGSIFDLVGRYGVNLRTLSVGVLSAVSDENLLSFPGVCASLTTLDLHAFAGVSGSAVARMIEHFPALLHLRLHEHQITDAQLSRIAHRCTQLRLLYLAGCRNIGDEGAQAVATHCTKLEVIDLTHCNRVSDVSVLALAQHCPLLTTVHLTHCHHVTDLSISTLCASHPALVSLHIGRCAFSIDEIIVSALSKCTHLTSLEMSGARVSDHLIMRITAQCTALTALYLDSCYKLSIVTIYAICNNLKGIQVLQLTSNAWVTNKHICLIAQNCPRLRYLKFGNSLLGVRWSRLVVQAATVRALALHCKKLTYLGCCECTASGWKAAQQMVQASAGRGLQLYVQLEPPVSRFVNCW